MISTSAPLKRGSKSLHYLENNLNKIIIVVFSIVRECLSGSHTNNTERLSCSLVIIRYVKRLHLSIGTAEELVAQ